MNVLLYRNRKYFFNRQEKVMAKIILNPQIKSIHGRIGNIIYYNVKGSQYARSYTIPRNPRTGPQQGNRASFAEAVIQWQKLAPGEKSYYDRLALGKPYSGYNLFISMRNRGITLSILKFINRKKQKSIFRPAAHHQAGTSVIASLLHDYSLLYTVFDGQGACGPPGAGSRAA